MLRAIVGMVAFCFLSSAGCVSASAEPGCASTATAIEFIQQHRITPLVLRGPAMKPLAEFAKQTGWSAVEHVKAMAVLFVPKGAAVFFVTEETTCGPMIIDHALVKKYLRPA